MMVLGLEWVEIVEPRTKERMYANLVSGECLWEPPPDVNVKHSSDDQWWELYDQKSCRFYYFNASLQKTVWHRPKDADIVPLAKLQTIKEQTSQNSVRRDDNKLVKHRRTTGSRGSTGKHVARNESTSSDSDNLSASQRAQDIHKRRHRTSGGKVRRSGDSQISATGNSEQVTSFSRTNPTYENVTLPVRTNSLKDDSRTANSSLVSDEQGSLDSSETRPKQAKLLPDSEYSDDISPLNSTMPELSTSHTPLMHARSKSHDAVNDGDVLLRHNESLTDRNENDRMSSLSKSQSFPQHSAPAKKDFRASKKRPSDVSNMESFAKSNLNVHKRGLLRKKITIHTMLSWTRDTIKKPMIMTKDKHTKKDACETFKLIQAYMGDKKVKKIEKFEIALDVITKGWQGTGLRDEIYIQLCRQTTGNPKPESMERGLELIGMCLAFFPPSTKFYSYLEGYICTHLDMQDSAGVNVSHYAEVSFKRLEKIIQTGAKRGQKKPTLDEVVQSQRSIFNPSMFGNTLDEVMELQMDKYPNHRLPWILTTLSEQVLTLGGNKTEGIFRVPGDIDEVNMLKVQIDQWNVPDTLRDPHVPGSLLKLWYRELAEPLIPAEFYDACVESYNNPNDAVNVVYSLPDINRLCLTYLIRFLQIFAQHEHSKVTKMDANNLAMVMAPNCLRCESNDPRIIFENTRKEMSYIRTLVQHLDTSSLDGVI
nr:rho GTPase-activating protein 39 [Ciona intestinalis]|eukprot:XP_002125699.2 rho GTPase-activating protein 39 [Ciona intestinalis]